MDRWPALMRRSTAADYLDISTTQFDRLNLESVQLTERGDRMWAREDLDSYIADLKKKPVRMSA